MDARDAYVDVICSQGKEQANSSCGRGCGDRLGKGRGDISRVLLFDTDLNFLCERTNTAKRRGRLSIIYKSLSPTFSA